MQAVDGCNRQVAINSIYIIVRYSNDVLACMAINTIPASYIYSVMHGAETPFWA